MGIVCSFYEFLFIYLFYFFLTFAKINGKVLRRKKMVVTVGKEKKHVPKPKLKVGNIIANSLHKMLDDVCQ